MNTRLPVKTTVNQIRPGDVFAYRPNLTPNDRLAAVVSVECVGGQPLADGSDSTHAPDLHRVRYADSDHLGTLFYGTESVYRAKRS